MYYCLLIIHKIRFLSSLYYFSTAETQVKDNNDNNEPFYTLTCHLVSPMWEVESSRIHWLNRSSWHEDDFIGTVIDFTYFLHFGLFFCPINIYK